MAVKMKWDVVAIDRSLSLHAVTQLRDELSRMANEAPDTEVIGVLAEEHQWLLLLRTEVQGSRQPRARLLPAQRAPNAQPTRVAALAPRIRLQPRRRSPLQRVDRQAERHLSG